MDMNVKLYSSDLREYMSTYFKNEQPYFLWLWTDAFGRSFASVAFAQGTTAGAVVEVFSDAFDEAALRAGAAGVAAAAYPPTRSRRNHGARCHFGTSSGSVLYAAAVSRVCRPGRRVVVLPRRAGCRGVASYRGLNRAWRPLASARTADDTVQVLLVESHAEGGPFSVRDFETTLNEARGDARAYDGENQWADFHYACRARASPWRALDPRTARRPCTLRPGRSRDQLRRRRRGRPARRHAQRCLRPDGRPPAPAGSRRCRQNVAGDLCATG